jgi:hypothetical protein
MTSLGSRWTDEPKFSPIPPRRENERFYITRKTAERLGFRNLAKATAYALGQGEIWARNGGSPRFFGIADRSSWAVQRWRFTEGDG